MTVTTAARPRTPGVVYGVLSMAMLLLIAAIALTARQAPPPTIAEFAPQAVDQIKEAPDEQSSRFGDGEGGAGGGGGETTTTTAAPPVDLGGPSTTERPVIQKARVRRCVGDPPRQTENPQSPPCVAYFEGDNGGATTFGVTANEIRIAVPDDDEVYRALERYFNLRYELYGRQIKLVKFTYDNNSDGRRASAKQVKEEVKAFAAAEPDGRTEFVGDLARLGVMSASHEQALPESLRAQWAPYVWSYPMDLHAQMANFGEWACKRVAGQRAAHAGRNGVEDMSQKQRKLGLFFFVYEDVPADPAPIKRELEKCGAGDLPFRTCSGDCIFDTAVHSDAILAFREAGVTSVLCLCQIIGLQQLFQASTSQQYFPEWLVTSYVLLDSNFTIKSLANRPEHLSHLFGTTAKPRQLRPSDDPAVQAIAEVAPDVAAGLRDSLQVNGAHQKYRMLLLLVAGIQMAGPKLTPETFEKAMRRTVFPNPKTPINAGDVGFASSHSMTTDMAEVWWSTTARGPYSDDAGTYCYVDGGARRKKGQWPVGGDPFFNGPCDSGG